jgi:hypothetical protein
VDEKYVWPLVGVALGWALSLFSTVLKDRAERRQKIGVLVSKLLHIHSQLLTLQQVTEIFKDNAETWEEYEPVRKRLTQRHFLEPESHVESLRDTIDEVSGLYPVEARSLHNLVDMLLKNKSTSLQASSKGTDLYIRMLSMYEVSLHGAEKILRESVRRYARRHGVLTYGAVLWELRRRKGDKYKKNVEFVEKLSAEVWEAIRHPERAPSSAQPSTPPLPASEAP